MTQRAVYIFALLIFSVACALAQKPDIQSVDKSIGHTQEKITIKGSFLGSDPTKVAVTFGGANGEVLSASGQIVEVKVPTGATYENIRLTNLLTGLSGYNNDPFLLSFGGQFGFTSSDLSAQLNFPAGAPA